MNIKKFLKSKKGLGIGDIGPIALTLGIAIIVISVVSLVLGTMAPMTYDTTTVNNETFNATSDPFNHTVSDASNTDFVELTSVTCYDTGSQSTELTCSIVDAEAGTVEVSGSVDADDESINYDYDTEGTSYSIVSKGQDALSVFADWFNIITIVSVAAIILGLVMLFRKTSSKANGRV